MDFASGLSGLAGGVLGMKNASGLPVYSGYTPQFSYQGDVAWGQAMQAIQAATDRNTGLVDPNILQSYSALMGIDLSSIVPAGQMAGQQYGALAGTASQFGGASAGMAGADVARAGAITQAGMDPQNQLHDYMEGQVRDQSRAADSARGLAMSPYSAGNESDALMKFNMDWQNQQLGRELAANTGAMGAESAAGANMGGAMGYYGAQPGLTMAAASAPIQAQQTVAGAPMDYANMFTGAEQANVINPNMTMQQQAGQYLGLAGQMGLGISGYDLNRANLRNQMQQQSLYGLFGGGQSGTNYMTGNTSGFGNPMSWMGAGGGP